MQYYIIQDNILEYNIIKLPFIMLIKLNLKQSLLLPYLIHWVASHC